MSRPYILFLAADVACKFGPGQGLSTYGRRQSPRGETGCTEYSIETFESGLQTEHHKAEPAADMRIIYMLALHASAPDVRLRLEMMNMSAAGSALDEYPQQETDVFCI